MSSDDDVKQESQPAPQAQEEGGSGGGAAAANPPHPGIPGAPPPYGYQMPPGFFPPQPQPMMPYPGGMMMGGPPGYGYGIPPMMTGGAVTSSRKKDDAPPTCTVHPFRLPRAFDVPFPEKKLPVCDRCKKNYRSRELCRSRDGHKALPWQTTYVVVTISDEVLVKGDDGSLSYHPDMPMLAELQDMPELCRGPADGSMAREPICPVCKEKNYTRDHCRNTLKHTTPPYQAIYVKLVPKSMSDSSDADILRPAKKKKRKPEECADGKPVAQEGDDDGSDESDDLTDIHESRTFFATINSKKVVVKWCEQIKYPESSSKQRSSSEPQQQQQWGMPPNASNPNVQYQLWDAFRAGAQWAQAGGGQMPGYQMPGGAPGYQQPKQEGGNTKAV